MRLPHQNQVNMVYSRDNRSLAKLSPKQMFESALRMRPDRILPAELRGEEAYFFFQNVVNSGHPGALTTIHANTAKLAFRRLANMIQSSQEGRGLEQGVILEMLYALVDIVIQTDKVQINDADENRKVVTEIYFDPAYARKQMG
ncbi:ATPase, T2SS/T4P/T4SS family (plasmid) [Xylella fastidiosa subsp. pauca]|nr:ATPase, T2SS/T4P/T4SS family [Xylella fastidiosa]MDG5826889.1 ATPase, T2SS/T4P/T4SS family [Xylella fastidiosa subsp. pauca]